MHLSGSDSLANHLSLCVQPSPNSQDETCLMQVPIPLWGATEEDDEGDKPEPPPRRFWNELLEPIYDSCPLPVQSVPSSSHHHSEESYKFNFTYQDGNQNWSFSPTDSLPCGPSRSLSERIRPLVHPSPPPEPKRKKAKTSKPTPNPPPTEEDLDDEPKRKNVPFKRKVAVEGQLRTYKIRMWPTNEQKRELSQMFTGARKAYNWALEQIKEHNHRINAIALRTKFRAEYQPPDFLCKDLNTRKHIVSDKVLVAAIKQVTDAYSSNFAKQKKNPSHSFEVKYRGRRNYTEVVKIEKDPPCGVKTSPLWGFKPVEQPSSDRRAECMAVFGCNLKDVGGIRLQDKQHVIDRLLAEGNRLKEDAKILWDRRTNSYHFIYTFEQPSLPDPDPTFANKRIASLDSGVDPFNAYYSPNSGEYGRLLYRFRDRLESRILKLDALQSRVDRRYDVTRDPATGKITAKNVKSHHPSRTKKQYRRTTRRLEKRLARERRRQYGWTEAAHYNAANFLLNKFDVIVNPKLATQRLSMRHGRRLRTKTARAMLTMSHYMFDCRLQWASTRYAGRHIIGNTGEPGTSKTCGNCGRWKPDLTLGDKVYCCERCGVKIHRDTANGARNNFFAALGKAMGIGPDSTSA